MKPIQGSNPRLSASDVPVVKLAYTSDLSSDAYGLRVRFPPGTPIGIQKFIFALRNSPNIRQALLSLDLSAKGANYEKAYRLIEENNIEHLKKE